MVIFQEPKDQLIQPIRLFIRLRRLFTTPIRASNEDSPLKSFVFGGDFEVSVSRYS